MDRSHDTLPADQRLELQSEAYRSFLLSLCGELTVIEARTFALCKRFQALDMNDEALNAPLQGQRDALQLVRATRENLRLRAKLGYCHMEIERFEDHLLKLIDMVAKP